MHDISRATANDHGRIRPRAGIVWINGHSVSFVGFQAWQRAGAETRADDVDIGPMTAPSLGAFRRHGDR